MFQLKSCLAGKRLSTFLKMCLYCRYHKHVRNYGYDILILRFMNKILYQLNFVLYRVYCTTVLAISTIFDSISFTHY